MCQKVVRGFVDGTGMPVRSAAARGAVATTTASALISSSAVRTCSAPTSMTRWSSRTVPAGRLAASSSGSREIPVDGTAGEPSRKERISSRAKVADVGALPVGEHPRQEGVEHRRPQLSRDAGPVQGLGQAEIRGREQPPYREQAGQRPADERHALAEGPDRAAQRGGQQPGESAGSARTERPSTPRDDDAGAERPEVELIEVHDATEGRIGGVDELEAAIAAEAVDLVGPHPSADRVGRLQHDDLETGGGQPLGTRQPGQSGPHDDDR